MTEAQTPINESAPYVETIVSKVASEALPEKGRRIINEKSSDGIPNLSKTGDKKLLSAFSAPDAINIEIETIRAHIDGKIENELFIPFFAPLKKLSK